LCPRAESVRAIKESDLKFIYDLYQSSSCSLSQEERVRNYAVYLISFLCLLRLQETLTLKSSNIEVAPGYNGFIRINLHQRKTSQQPFVIWHNDDKPWLCPMRAILNYVLLMKRSDMPPSYDTNLFRNVSFGKLLLENGKHVKYDAFKRQFAQDMALIYGDKYKLFGTHSFRRGGCQYYHCELGWNLKKLCDLGGWSMDFDNLNIVRYPVGALDDELCSREDYLKPSR
jgi:hypothetical protein